MRILLLADMHFREDWYTWVAQQNFDMTSIAGDLLHGLRVEGLLPQMILLKKWCENFPRCLSLSSGNHDNNIEQGAMAAELWEITDPVMRGYSHQILSAKLWTDALEKPGIITDCRSGVIETAGGSLVVTTIPFYPDRRDPNRDSLLWSDGERLRRETGFPWLVLHHAPPAETLVGDENGAPELPQKIREMQPDFVLSGHVHLRPYRGSFADKIGKTWCFNPGMPPHGQALRSRKPNCIILDLAERTAVWNASPLDGKTPLRQKIHLDTRCF